jgi:hypothetical protein
MKAFALALLATGAVGCSTAAPAASPSSGIDGQAILGPTCPVQRAGQSCAKGYATTLVVYRAKGHRRVKTVRTTSDGHFRVVLSPGRYVLEGARPGPPLARSTTAVVLPQRFTRVTVSFDTGIR